MRRRCDLVGLLVGCQELTLEVELVDHAALVLPLLGYGYAE
jgi:hypothetical protein